MPPKRKISFDPLAAKAEAKKKKDQQDAIHKIQESAKAFLGVIEMYESATLSPCDCDPATMELCLVAKLDLNGICSIKLATKAVPKNHPNRLETIASIANYSLSNKVHSSRECY